MGSITRVALLLALGACGGRFDAPGAPDASPPDASPPDATPAPIPDFAFTVSAPVRPAQGGAPVAVGIHLTRRGGFAGTVSVDVGGLPGGLTATSAVFGPGVSDATLTVQASLAMEQGRVVGATLRGTSAELGERDTPLDVFVRGCPGCLDTTFGVKGYPVMPGDTAQWVQIDASNRLLVVVFDGSRMSVVRFDEDGVLDTSFGKNGTALLPFTLIFNLTALAVDAKGSITVGGTYGPKPEFARFSNDGTLDQAFGTGGEAIVPFTNNAFHGMTRLIALPDGSVVGAGMEGTGPSKPWLVKVLPNGAFDPTFGTAGQAVLPWPVDAYATESVIQPIGTKLMVAATSAGAAPADDSFSLMRLNADGSADPSFGVGGEVHGAVPGAVSDMIPTQGQTFTVSGFTYPSSPEQTRIARFRADGALDPSFGKAGVITIAPIATLDMNRGLQLAEQPDGKILVAGYARTAPDAWAPFVARLDTDGTYDAGFGNAGVATLATAQPAIFEGGPSLQKDGRIVVCGETWKLNSDPKPVLLRYWP